MKIPIRKTKKAAVRTKKARVKSKPIMLEIKGPRARARRVAVRRTKSRFVEFSKNRILISADIPVAPVVLHTKSEQVSRRFISFFPRRSVRKAFASSMAAVLIGLIISMPLLLAFEAHVINVTAQIFQIDTPTFTPAGGTNSGPVEIGLTDDDADATHIFYTTTPGSDPLIAPNPICGISAGGPKPRGPISLSGDAVIKAVACDGDTPLAHASVVRTEIYVYQTPYGKIEGHKYHDLDRSGTLTAGDTPLEGWHITLKKGVTTVETTVTDGSGYYLFDDLSPDTYTVEEENRDGWEQLTPGSVTLSVAGGETKLVNFFNKDTGFACVPKDVHFPSSLAVQAGGASASNDDIVLASNVTINGDVRSNDEIEKSGGGSNRTINGNASTTGAIESGITITGHTATGTPTVLLPDIMTSEWKARAQDGGTVNGSFIFPSNTTGLSMGPSEIMGDVTFGSSNGVTIRGPLYIHGNLTIGAGTVITEDAAFGNQFVAIIVDGIIDISSATFSGSGTSGAILLVSTHTAVSGTSAAIQTSSNTNTNLGAVVLYAENADMHISSNKTLLGTFATHGTGSDSDDNGAVRFDSNVVVNYRALPGKISCGARQPYELTSHILINEFLPNPAGSDVGSPGLPHNGEWVELFNPTASTVDVAGYVLYDNNNAHALPIVVGNTSTSGTTIPAGGYLVVYRDGDADFELTNNGGDSVRLFSAPIGSGGVLVDSHTYVRDAPDDKSFARVPDGAANWVDPEGTPGEPNMFFVAPIDTKPNTPIFEPSDKPLIDLTIQKIEEPKDLPHDSLPETHASQNNADVPPPIPESTTTQTEVDIPNLSVDATSTVPVPSSLPSAPPPVSPDADVPPAETNQNTSQSSDEKILPPGKISDNGITTPIAPQDSAAAPPPPPPDTTTTSDTPAS